MAGKLHRWGRVAALAGFSVLATQCAVSQEATLVADAHVSSAQPGVNSGTLSNLNVGGGYTALVQFGLGTLPANVTAAQITRATLRVYCNRADTPGTVSVAPVGGAWGEYSVTYATMPAVRAVVQTAQVGAAGEFVTFDVTSVVQGWVTAPATNNGLALTAGTAVVQFDSKENDETAHEPELDIALAAGGTGTVGPEGPAGPQGVAGPVGAEGPAGIQGPAGPQGLPGLTGLTGAQGPIGLIGATGLTGAAGPQGSIGPQGPAGTQGLMGLTGVAGPAGATGITGPMGPAGAPGLVYQGNYSSTTNYALGDVVVFGGTSYASLTASNHGNTPGLSPEDWEVLAAQGPAGTQGAIGNTGAQGPQGLLGPVGPPGEQGAQGLQGIPGQAGAQGIPGTTGAQGLQGPMGPEGPAGPVGMSWQGAYSSITNYGLGDGVSWQGSGWVSLVSSNHGNTPDLSPSDWAMFAAAGAQGTVGATGVAGAAGGTGPQGPQGVAGVDGAPGAEGVAGSPGLVYRGGYQSTTNYALGDVVVWGGSSYASLEASNHGNTPDLSPTAWGLLASVGGAGPQGVIGLSGPTGSQGVQGPVGPAGPAGGQGVQGPQGPVGAQGLTGVQGALGDVGPQGPQGLAGQEGAQGVQGLTGSAGPQGPQGAQGPVGAVGAAGTTGAAGAVGMNFRSAWSAQSNYAVNDAVTFDGSTYLAQSANNNVEPDGNAETWMVVAQAGSTGPTGAAGTAAGVAIGTVTTLAAGSAATVSNSGTAQAAVLNFGIPQGATGAPGSSGGGTGTATGSSFAAMYHAVNYSAYYYSVNTPNGSVNEDSTVIEWVPLGCTATRLDVYSLQSGSITVTLRSGTPGSMADTALTCKPATAGSCPATGTVAIAAGSFVDLHITGSSSTAAGVWTALQCN